MTDRGECRHFVLLLARSGPDPDPRVLTPSHFFSNCPSYGPGTEKGLETELTGWMLGGKSPGAMGLEHESGDLTVEGFINTYSGIQQNGWDAR